MREAVIELHSHQLVADSVDQWLTGEISNFDRGNKPNHSICTFLSIAIVSFPSCSRYRQRLVQCTSPTISSKLLGSNLTRRDIGCTLQYVNMPAGKLSIQVTASWISAAIRQKGAFNGVSSFYLPFIRSIRGSSLPNFYWDGNIRIE